MVTRPEEFAALPYHSDLVGFRAEDGFPLDGLLYSPRAGATTAVILVAPPPAAPHLVLRHQRRRLSGPAG